MTSAMATYLRWAYPVGLVVAVVGFVISMLVGR